MKFSELIAKHGTTPHQIPNDDLYAYMEDNREDILNQTVLGVERVPESPLGQEVIRRCKTDLYWLAAYFLWRSNPISENGMVPFSENIFLNDYYKVVASLFIKKDPSKKLSKQSSIKNRLLLSPRGSAKSTFDHCDSVQWVLVAPSVRLLYLTAEVSLAEGFVGEIKGHFYIKEDPTWMQVFFPQFCVEEGKSGAANEFICPVYAAKKTGRKEPTIFASSNGKAKAGWRFEIIKADDAVSDSNSETDAACEKVSKQLFLSEKLLALGGHYVDYIGTRYNDQDHYGILLEKNIGDITTTYGQGWELIENTTTKTNILIGRAMTIKPEVVQRLERNNLPVTYQNAGADGVTLLLPHLMSYEWCMEDFTKDEISFEGQRNQNPRPAAQATFTRAIMLKATVPFHEIPASGAVSQVWDFAFSKKKGRDYSVGTSILWTEEDEFAEIVDEQGLVTHKKTGLKITVGHVLEVVRARFNQLELAQAVVSLAQKYKPFVVGVEKAAGSDFLKPTLDMEAYRTQDQHTISVVLGIDWFSPDNQKDAKRTRMAALYPPVVQRRLRFAAHCMALVEAKQHSNPMDLLYDEFEKCLDSHHHDDIPDNIAMQQRYAPRATQVLVTQDQTMMYHTDPHWNLIFEPDADKFGRINFGPSSPTDFEQDMSFEQQDMQSTAPQGLGNILGVGYNG